MTEARPAAPAAPAPSRELVQPTSDCRNWERTSIRATWCRLMISPGSKVSEGQPVMELETDKAVVEVPSSVTGTVKEIKVKEGEKVKVGQVIFTLEGGASRSRRKRSTHRSNTFPNNTKLACRCRPRSRPRARPRPRYFCRTSLSRMLPKLSPCRSSWAKWLERSIAHLLPPRLTSVAWREKSASTFTKSRAAAPADASAKTM